MKRRFETDLGLTLAVVLLAIAAHTAISDRLDLHWRRGTTVFAMFPDIHNLREGGAVLLGGMEVGAVEDIRLVPEQGMVRVRLRLTDAGAVRTDSVASIQQRVLGGDALVILTVGSGLAPKVEENATLLTEPTTDLSHLLGKVDSAVSGAEAMVESMSFVRLEQMTKPFGDFMRTNAPVLSDLISQVEVASEAVASGRGTVGGFVMDRGEFHDDFVGLLDRVGEISLEARGLSSELDETLVGLRTGSGTVGALLMRPGLGEETTLTASHMRQLAEKINQGPGTLSLLLNDSSLYRNVKVTLPRLERSIEGLEDQGPTTVLGLVFGSVIPKK